ncbi:MAG: rRNA maturation RNase YbeY [Chloroflexi bacterium HGW-Chloroflexi-8]|nr:MAG: rRNA maturation RNase YbeY [Chloroflexi bacterium HGW-Chloroflexi-8]
MRNKIQLDILNDHNYSIPIGLDLIVINSLDMLGYKKNCIISIAFIDDKEIKKLYKEYFGYAKTTDVLSFPSDTIDPETGFLFLGDIVIDFPFVQKQAISLENKLDSEIYLLIIHGLLHLLGYDHTTENEKSVMWELQKKILSNLNIIINKLPE